MFNIMVIRMMWYYNGSSEMFYQTILKISNQAEIIVQNALLVHLQGIFYNADI